MRRGIKGIDTLVKKKGLGLGLGLENGGRAITMPAVVFKTKVLHLKIENTPMKETN